MLLASMRCSIPGLGVLLTGAIGGLAACASPASLPAGGPASGSAEASRGQRVRPDFGGWVLAPEAAAGNEPRVLADGSRCFILRGTRWVDHPDGSAERSLEVFQEDDVKSLELAPHQGGGFLFYVSSGAGTLLWRADSWTGEARPLGRIDPPASEIIAGFDRLYLKSATSYSLRAIDALTGKAVDLSPLPPASAYGDMVFADAWTAVVLAGIRGALATFDAGESWHAAPTPAPVTSLTLLADGGVALATERGRFELGRTGKLLALGARGEDAAFRGLSTFSSYAPDAFTEAQRRSEPQPSASLTLGRRPLRAAVLGGWPDTPETAVAIDEGVLGRVRLSDGKLLAAQPFAGKGPCRGVALGSDFGFVCGDARSDTEVYAYRHGRAELAFRLDGPHPVRSSGNGALVIAAPCERVRSASGPERAGALRAKAALSSGDHFCARAPSGELFDVDVRGEAEADRVAALRDGRVAVLNPPRSNAPGRLSLLSRDGTRSEDLVLDPDTGPAARLVRSGLWLDELWELPSGELGAWVVGARAYVGVRIDLAGNVRIARVQDGVDETSFFGPDALHVAGAASLRETTDYGFEWRVSALPPAVLSPASAARSRWPARGCSAVGCVYDDWLRIGFSGERGVPEPVHPAIPERVAFEGARFAFWTLSCDVVPAEHGDPADRAPPAPQPLSMSLPSPGDPRPPGGVPESSAWISFQGEAGPKRAPSSVGYDFGATNETGAYHAYVWGPTSGGWSRRGMWQARVGDRFSTAPPWSTAVSRSPWPDPASAAQAFGLDTTTGVDWWFRPGDGKLAAIQLRVRSDSMVHLFERNRAIVTLDLGKLPDLGVVTGAYAVGDRWYLGATRAEQFHLYRVEGDEPVRVGSYPLLGRVTAQLVGSVHGDELGIWTRSSGAGWQVFPIDLRSFEAQPPIHVPAAALGTVPPPCDRGRPGWMIVAGVPLTEASVSESNTHVEFTGGAEGLKTKRLTARVVMDEAGVCVDALAALVDGPSPVDLQREHRDPRRVGLPLTVTDPVDERRWSFRCSP
jgi:hypothetical protein